MDAQIRFILASDINAAIRSISWPNSYQEPDYVAKLVTTLPKALKTSLRNLLPGRDIKVGGAFIHQKPLAHFVNPPYNRLPSPELGDLLVVCRESRASGFVYNALLLQAKCVKDVYHSPIPMDHQFLLYSKWPAFIYARAGYLNGVRRSIYPKTITQGAKYLLIDRNDPFYVFTATVNNPLEGETPFPCELASVIAFDRGRTFRFGHPRDMWSKVICDLLEVSAHTKFNRRHQNFNNVNRYQGDNFFDHFLDEEYDIPIIDDMDEEGSFSGVSVICVDLGQDESSKEDL